MLFPIFSFHQIERTFKELTALTLEKKSVCILLGQNGKCEEKQHLNNNKSHTLGPCTFIILHNYTILTLDCFNGTVQLYLCIWTYTNRQVAILVKGKKKLKHTNKRHTWIFWDKSECY